LDTQHLREYAPARSLFDLLVKYPQEVVPIMDFVVYDYMKTKYPDFSSHQRIQVTDFFELILRRKEKEKEKGC